MTRDTKPHASATCSLNVTTVGADDGLDVGEEASAGFDDAGHFQVLPCCHDASLQRLQVGVRNGLDPVLQNA